MIRCGCCATRRACSFQAAGWSLPCRAAPARPRPAYRPSSAFQGRRPARRAHRCRICRRAGAARWVPLLQHLQACRHRPRSSSDCRRRGPGAGHDAVEDRVSRHAFLRHGIQAQSRRLSSRLADRGGGADPGGPRMIITRAPLRITLGGGGTDLPSYYEQFGGFVLSAAISKYIFISVNRTFTPDYFLKYSALERVERPDRIEHPIVREVLLAHDIGPSVEIVSMADIPSGTGLGSAGAFTVGLLHAVYAFRRDHVTAGDLADEACAIEIDRLCRAVGKQDQYVAAFGGVKCFDFKPDGQVAVSPLAMSTDTLHDLEEHLLMFFTGYSRDADMVLVEQKVRSEGGDTQMIDNLHFVKELGLRSKAALEQGDTEGFAVLMHEHWEHKKKRSASMSNSSIDRWYQLGRDSGALGGKLVGAGAGGFLLFYTCDQRALRQAMAAEGLTEVRFTFDHDGSTVLARD